jgi:hypothetical protein
MSAIVVAGDTSGSVTLQAPAVSGTTVITLPATSGTMALATNSTRQVLLSGTSATYTTPAGCKQLKIRLKGGGSGGAGAGTTGPNDGAVGGTTTFNSINANGGAAPQSTYALAGRGGKNGSGTASVRIAGAPGQAYCLFLGSGTSYYAGGGSGGGSGGGVTKGAASSGDNAVDNTGGGGSGGGTNLLTFAQVYGGYLGVGGGEGEYVEIIINNPSATYTYTVGAGGAAGSAGTNGFAGGAGGSGYIIVDEFY